MLLISSQTVFQPDSQVKAGWKTGNAASCGSLRQTLCGAAARREGAKLKATYWSPEREPQSPSGGAGEWPVGLRGEGGRARLITRSNRGERESGDDSRQGDKKQGSGRDNIEEEEIRERREPSQLRGQTNTE